MEGIAVMGMAMLIVPGAVVGLIVMLVWAGLHASEGFEKREDRSDD
ncbi:hypothetical protein [Antribacter gilvus]|nr:hypothetical protein [Antribacter gilvus]